MEDGMLNQQQCGWNAPQQFVIGARNERELVIDADVKRVVEYMLGSVEAAKLLSVAQAVAQLAPILWGHHERVEVRTLALQYAPITSIAGGTPTTAT
jgi:hypothetical protein